MFARGAAAEIAARDEDIAGMESLDEVRHRAAAHRVLADVLGLFRIEVKEWRLLASHEYF